MGRVFPSLVCRNSSFFMFCDVHLANNVNCADQVCTVYMKR